MIRELKNQWLKDLRSGKYLQAREKLVGESFDYLSDEWQTYEDGETDDCPPPIGIGYCCQGIALISAEKCGLLHIDWETKNITFLNGEGPEIEDEYGNIDVVTEIDLMDEEELPRNLLRWFGIKDGSILIKMNDDRQNNFNEIADHIEENE